MAETLSEGFFRPASGALLALLLAACAGPVRQVEAPLFFPPAPELPRVQFLTSFKGLRDIGEQSRFERFVVGETQDVRLDKPYGIGVHDGRVYVCDVNATVVVFDFRNKSFGALKGATGPGRLVEPINISIDPDGTKYVADPGRGQVVVFGPDDAYVKALGAPGPWRPVDAARFEDRVYVADPANGLVQVFDDLTGALVKSIGAQGEPAERLDRPTNLAFDGEGYLYVTDASRFQVVKFDRDGHFKSTFGMPGDSPGHFARPKGIALDRDGHLFVVDASFGNVQLFDRSGRLLMFFGEGGERPGTFLLPAKVVIDYDNVRYFERLADPQFQVEYLIFVTSQLGDQSVSVLAAGKEKGKSYPTEDDLLKQIESKRQQVSETPR